MDVEQDYCACKRLRQSASLIWRLQLPRAAAAAIVCALQCVCVFVSERERERETRHIVCLLHKAANGYRMETRPGRRKRKMGSLWAAAAAGSSHDPIASHAPQSQSQSESQAPRVRCKLKSVSSFFILTPPRFGAPRATLITCARSLAANPLTEHLFFHQFHRERRDICVCVFAQRKLFQHWPKLRKSASS